jgi:hypothetical protein
MSDCIHAGKNQDCCLVAMNMTTENATLKAAIAAEVGRREEAEEKLRQQYEVSGAAIRDKVQAESRLAEVERERDALIKSTGNHITVRSDLQTQVERLREAMEPIRKEHAEQAQYNKTANFAEGMPQGPCRCPICLALSETPPQSTEAVRARDAVVEAAKEVIGRAGDSNEMDMALELALDRFSALGKGEK